MPKYIFSKLENWMGKSSGVFRQFPTGVFSRIDCPIRLNIRLRSKIEDEEVELPNNSPYTKSNMEDNNSIQHGVNKELQNVPENGQSKASISNNDGSNPCEISEADEQPQELDEREVDGVKQTFINSEWVNDNTSKPRKRSVKEYPLPAKVTIGNKTYQAHARATTYKKGELGYTIKLDKGQKLLGFGTFKVLGVSRDERDKGK